MDTEKMGIAAKSAARVLGMASTNSKNKALEAMAAALEVNAASIISANEADLDNGKQNGMRDSLLDRLRLTPERIAGMADGIRQVAALADPIGEIIEGSVRPNGMKIQRVRVPLGVVGIIFEARPNVTSDAAALCLKSGNACILRGGKEAIHSNMAIAKILREAVASAGLPADCIQLVSDTSRESANQMMRMSKYLDVLIPRGGAGLIRAVVKNSTVPDIIFNAKTSRPSVCNAIETILIHRDIAQEALPVIKARLDEKNVELRGCDRTRAILGDSVVPATDEDYATEFSDYILACRVVDSLEQAIEHIAKYSTGHSECIVTSDYFSAELFTSAVDSAAVYVNCSTRFTDGGEFGLGAEIGISTQKLHARGPMGIRQLTSSKFIIQGDGQIR